MPFTLHHKRKITFPSANYIVSAAQEEITNSFATNMFHAILDPKNAI